MQNAVGIIWFWCPSCGAAAVVAYIVKCFGYNKLCTGLTVPYWLGQNIDSGRLWTFILQCVCLYPQHPSMKFWIPRGKTLNIFIFPALIVDQFKRLLCGQKLSNSSFHYNQRCTLSSMGQWLWSMYKVPFACSVRTSNETIQNLLGCTLLSRKEKLCPVRLKGNGNQRANSEEEKCKIPFVIVPALTIYLVRSSYLFWDVSLSLCMCVCVCVP